jgi:plastocyanin
MKPPLAVLAVVLAGALPLFAASHRASSAPEQPPLVRIQGFAFHPATLTVSPGETVTFVNDDDDAHTVTSRDRLFDSGGLDTHERWSHRFEAAGTYPYFCALHPMMIGTIVVRSGGKGTP